MSSRRDGASRVASPKPYLCVTCGKQYQRNTHLRRHEATHAATGKFRCIYCDKEFARGDVCRKHILSCISRTDDMEIPEKRKGRKPKACEACFVSKLSCDKGNPCSRCVLRHLPCRVREVADARPHEQSMAAQKTPVAAKKTELKFIKGITNPQAASMLEHLVNDKSINERIPDMSHLGNSAPNSLAISEVDDFSSIFPMSFASLLDDALHNYDGKESLGMLSLEDVPPVPFFSPESATRLEQVSDSLINELQDLDNELRATDPMYNDPFDIHDVTAALSPKNLKRFAANFFRLSHCHFPIIHIPTFGLQDEPKSFMLVLAVQGAFRSPPLDDVLAARGLLRLAEEYVFRELEGAVSTRVNGLPSLPTLQILQSAVIIVYLLVINNSVTSRRRSRAKRVPELVSAVRSYGLVSVRHRQTSDWQEFIHYETCIRIATWTAVADWHQCGMFRCMPVMTTAEMTCSHPCSPELWDANDSEDFLAQLAREHRQRAALEESQHSCIGGFLDLLMSNRWNPRVEFTRESLNIFDINTVCVALSAVTITADIMSLLPASAPALLRALARWQALWDQSTKNMDSDALNKAGMAAYGPEMCALTRKIIDARLSRSQHAFFQKVGHESLAELYGLVLQC